MGKFWLKIWIWIKVIFAIAMLSYIVAFVIENHGNHADFWLWYNKLISTTSLILASGAFGAGLITSFLLRTVTRTARQLRDLKGRSQDQRTAREQEDIKAKAAMLRTKPAGSVGDKSA